MISKTKQCYRCKEIKPITAFCYCSDSNDRLGSWCRICVDKKVWEAYLHNNYNITIKQYELLLKSQNRRCAICQQFETVKQNGRIQRLSVDHNHKTNKIRGLLCVLCNSMLGRAKDNPEILRKAAEYLEK